MYPNVQLFIDGKWRDGGAGTIPVLNPATEEQIGTVARADRADLDRALAAAERGFALWRAVPAYNRAKILVKAADILRERTDMVARLMVMEQGKPFAQAKGEVQLACDALEWFAGEASRAYGRVIPARGEGIYQLVVKEPVGPVAAFTPWNIPVNQASRKICLALAAGCSVILKAAEETPASSAEVVRALAEAGVPDGVMNLVYGVPAEISEYLIPHPTIRKITFTGSTVVGKQLAQIAGAHMKRLTMELGGHSPVLIFDDADVDLAAAALAQVKYRNSGQGCISPTRFLVQEKVYDRFVDQFVTHAEQVKVGEGFEPGVIMGPLANGRRVAAMEGFVADAVKRGARLRTGGKRLGNKGYFFAPTVLSDVPLDARVMNEEPFGPMALMAPFKGFDDAMAEANRLPYGLSAYAYTRSVKTASAFAAAVEAGMVSINHHGLGLPEVPFGGVKDSGQGSDGGVDAMEGYFVTKFVTQASA